MATFTYDGTTLKAYKNTTLNSVGGSGPTITGPIAAGTTNISFCVNPAYNGDWYPGMIAGVAVYSLDIGQTDVTSIFSVP
jgi:hypothetical protein